MEKTNKKVKMSYIDLNKILILGGSQLENYNFVVMLGNERFSKKVSMLLKEMKQFENLETLSKTKQKNRKSLIDVVSSVLLKGEITRENILTLLDFVSKDHRRVSSSVKNFLISNNIEGVWY